MLLQVNPNDFADPLSLHLAPPAGQGFHAHTHVSVGINCKN